VLQEADELAAAAVAAKEAAEEALKAEKQLGTKQLAISITKCSGVVGCDSPSERSLGGHCDTVDMFCDGELAEETLAEEDEEEEPDLSEYVDTTAELLGNDVDTAPVACG